MIRKSSLFPAAIASVLAVGIASLGAGAVGVSVAGAATHRLDRSAALSTCGTTTPVTITLSDGWGTTGTGALFGSIIKNFEKQCPDVTINRDTSNYNTYQESISLRGSSPNPPDIMMLEDAGYGQGFYSLVKGGDLLPLNSYEKQYGWDSRFGSSADLDTFRFDTKDNQWGSGPLYGLPEQNAMVGVFYNKKLLKEAGYQSPPTTFAQFEATLAAAKAKGITGIAESSTYIHTEMALWDAFAPSVSSVNDWIYGASGTFADAANEKAAKTMLEWTTDGYFEPGAAAVSDSDAAAMFESGKSLYYIEGSWIAGGAQTSLGTNAGFFQMPSVSEKSPVGGGLTTPLVISAKTKHPAVAAAFLNYFISLRVSDDLLEGGWGVPGANVSLSVTNPKLVVHSVIKLLAKVEGPSGGGTTPFLNWAAPALTQSLPADLQSLCGGQLSVSDFTSQIQSEWTTFKHQRSK